MNKLAVLAAGALMTLAPIASSAAVRVFVGAPVIGYGFYGPAWAPAWAPYYAPYANSGTVKIDSKDRSAEIFINGSYAGTLKDNRTMHLRPGSYKFEIRAAAGQTLFAENIYVTAGKTLHINPAA